MFERLSKQPAWMQAMKLANSLKEYFGGVS
jgi:hypothetical protein